MISRRILAAIALLCLFVSPSYAQKSKATLTTEINTNWPDNTTGSITPALLRSTVIDIINSYVDWLTCTGSGGVVYWNAGTPTCLAAASNGQFLGLSSGLPAWLNIASQLTAGPGITITGTSNATISITNSITGGGPTGSATVAPIITYNAQGELTVVTSATITPALTSVTSVGANSFVANNTGSTANATTVNAAQAGAMLCAPSRSVLTSGTNATYSTPTCNSALPTRIELEMVGPGGGSSGSGSAPGAGGTPASGTCWNSSGTACSTPLYLAGAGAGASISNNTSASGGSASSCDLNLSGGNGGFTSTTSGTIGGIGGGSFFGPGGVSGNPGAGGSVTPANTGAGAGGPGFSSAENGGGGAGGGYCRKIITSPASSYVYTVGPGGAAGAAGSSGAAGIAGSAGLIIVTAYWQ